MWIVIQEHVRSTRRSGEFRCDEHQFQGREVNPSRNDIRLFHFGDDCVILADDSDLQWPCQVFRRAVEA